MWYRLSNKVRPILAVVGFLGAVVAPPWVPLIAMLLLALRFAAWEIVAIGFFVDLIWFPLSAGGLASLPIFTLIGIVLVWGLEPLRSEFLVR